MKCKRFASFLLALCMIFTMLPVLAQPSQATETQVERIYGATRYETSLKTADAMKQVLGVSKFQNIVVASGTNFADALGGSYLAVKKQAPILLVQKSTAEKIKTYIRANLQQGGTVYLLGGTGAVPKEMESGLDGFQIKRLGGADRYETNLMILKEAGVKYEEIIVCTGTNYADSLSASALGRPILLVKNTITPAQKEFLAPTIGGKIIIGGYNAVSKDIQKLLEYTNYGTGGVRRIGGATRYQTSAMVALWFFENPSDTVIAYGKNFPDGLCAGPFAYLKKCPMILSANGQETPAQAYIQQQRVQQLYVWGGPSLISDKSASLLASGFSYATRNTDLPDLAAFMKKEPDFINKQYRNGTLLAYYNLPESMDDTVIQEVLSLLQEDRYQLELVGKFTEEEVGYVLTLYNFLYVGNGIGFDLLSQDTFHRKMYNIQFKIRTPVGANDASRNVEICLHFCNGFTLSDPGKRLSVTLPTPESPPAPDDGGGDDGDGDDDGEKTCSRCGGDGKCTKCNGSGYIYKWVSGTEHDYVKQTCTTCNGRGKCTWCGGDGKK